MSLADRLAAAREARGESEDGLEPGEGLPEDDHTVPDPASPEASAAAAADAARSAGKRRADVPPAVGGTTGAARPAATEQRRPFINTSQSDRIEELKSSVHVQLLQQMGPRLYDAEMDQNELDAEVRKILADVLGSQDRPLSSSDRARVTQDISDDILGYGPIEPFLRDPDVSEVMVNGQKYKIQ